MRVARLAVGLTVLLTAWPCAAQVTVPVGGNIQELIDAHPGQVVYLAPGDFEVDEAIRITTDGAGLSGPGRIIQKNPDEGIVFVGSAKNVRVEGLTLTRASGKEDTITDGLRADHCEGFVARDVRVIGNRTSSAGITLDNCTRSSVLNCLVQDYMTVTIDDRTDNKDLGYAFNCIDGTGIKIRSCNGTLVQGNRVVELHLRPTPEIKAQYNLGKMIKRNAQRGVMLDRKHWDAEYFPAWHQGSGILVNPGETTAYTQLIGNFVENAAQGIDIHSDHIIVSGNIIKNSFFGMKAMHGSRSVMITNNQFSRNDLWSIVLMPGAASHPPEPGKDGKPAAPANVDGGSIIANNIISDFGYGDSYWIWKDFAGDQHNCPISLMSGQMADDPPLRDVIIQGNVVYDTGRDRVVIEGKLKHEPPRYRYAVYVSTDEKGPKGVHFSGNILHPGTKGVCNIDMLP